MVTLSDEPAELSRRPILCHDDSTVNIVLCGTIIIIIIIIIIITTYCTNFMKLCYYV